MTAIQIYDNFDNLQRAAMALQQSGYFKDAATKAQAITKVMAGYELGLPPFASMAGIHVIQGKPVLGSNVIATLVKNDPRYDYHIKQADDKACILTWYEDGEEVGEAGFTIQEAKDAGLAGKDNWKRYTSDMLFARAISRGARRFAPGIFGGSPVYTPDEMGVDTDEDGYIEGESVTIEDPENETNADQTPDEVEYEGENEPMTIERAMKVTNSEGVEYGTLDSETLSAMTIGIDKGLKKDDLSDDKRETYLMKRDAIKVILQARADGSIQQQQSPSWDAGNRAGVPIGKGSEMKKKIYSFLSNWLIEHGKGSHEADRSCYVKDLLVFHAIFTHDSRWQWEDLAVTLFYCVTLFRYCKRASQKGIEMKYTKEQLIPVEAIRLHNLVANKKQVI